MATRTRRSTTTAVKKKGTKRMNSTLLQEYIGRTPIGYTNQMKEGFEYIGETYNPDRHTHVGIEIEVEGIINHAYETWLNNRPHWFSVHSDGSLRNGGVEFITYPFDATYAPSILNYFFTNLKRTNPGFTFTNRCSIHVHLDMTDTTYWQFESLYQLYLCFERQFYEYAGEVRENSNFCVPVSATPFEEYFFSTTKSRTWNTLLNSIPDLDAAKYTGLNITRLRDIGTVEFRHLPGNIRAPWVYKFIQFIIALKKFAITHTRDEVNDIIMNANTISNYQPFAESVFGEHTNALFPTGEFNLIEEGITTAKRIYFDRSNVSKEESLRKLLKSPTMMEKISKVMDEVETTRAVPQTRPARRGGANIRSLNDLVAELQPLPMAQPVYWMNEAPQQGGRD